MKYKIKTDYQKRLADTLTPMGIYLQLRSKYAQVFMLESSDYHGDEHTYSYICFDPFSTLKIEDEFLVATFPDGNFTKANINKLSLSYHLNDYQQSFKSDCLDLPCISGGMFGYMTYDCIEHFEDITLSKPKPDIPSLSYCQFRYLLAINHFTNDLFIIRKQVDGDAQELLSFDELFEMVSGNKHEAYPFKLLGDKTSNCTDEEFIEMVKKGIFHCYRGDVFQIVLSRRFQYKYEGDDIQVYRALRSINPSPYLFYFDFGNFKLFGSSPEAQLIIKDSKATIHPIAGTFRRTGNDIADAALAKQLIEDPKENAEHIMLVDLARNDLSKHGNEVKVEVYREVQYYSHVIHLVSKVTGNIRDNKQKVNIVGDTFPAGTLTGAPKYRAMQLIDDYEKTPRSFYGGCIGHWSLNGDFNHAIMIRTFLSKDNTLTSQAGAGIVADSKPESELQEVENKLMALNKAVELAEKL
jgi:anthranilate synthase component I